MSKRTLIMLIPFLLFFSVQMNALAEGKKERSWQDESIYFIMVDRFNNGDKSNDSDSDRNDPYAYQGGDIKGITEKLDYIKSLGSTAIWLTPIVKNEEKGYHGYWTEDFYQVEEHFGTIEDLKTLVKEAHKRDMKVILDLVVNHTGYKHPWLSDAGKKDWYHKKEDIWNYEDQQQVENGWLSGLPDLNQNNPETKRYLLDMAKFWIEKTDIDGYRLDTVKHVPKSFWTDFSKAVKSVKPDFYLLGEVWHNDPAYLAGYEKTGIASFVDYPLYNEMTIAFSQSEQPLSELFSVWERNQYYFNKPYEMGNFLDNHDNMRFVRQARLKQEDPEKRLKLALTYLYTAPGIPILYQGTELAMDGGQDPDNRRFMSFGSHKKMVKFTSEVARLRQKHPALRKGSYKLIADRGTTAVFKRSYNGEVLYITYNNSKKEKSIVFRDKTLSSFNGLKGLLTLVPEVDAELSGKKAVIQLPAETAQVIQPYKTNYNLLWLPLGVAIVLLFTEIYRRKLRK